MHIFKSFLQNYKQEQPLLTHIPNRMQTQQEEPLITTQKVIQSYQQLSSEDPQKRHQANQFLFNLIHCDEAWRITQHMLNTVQDPNFQFLGAQILYQKIQNQLLSLSKESKLELREFIFLKLETMNITNNATIDKLASIGAIIASISVLGQWKSFIPDMIGFMSKSQHNLKSGLFVLERVPQELRATSKLAPGLKNNIIDQFLKSQDLLAKIFMEVLNLNNDILINKCLQAMQSWAKSRFNFLKNTQLVKKVLLQSLTTFQKFQSGIVMIVETIKGAASNRCTSISEWQPSSQLTKYSTQQIQSIKLIIQYIIENKNNFTQNSTEPEHLDMYLDIIKNSLLSFGFLITESIGFQLLDLILHFTRSSDLKVSQGTFQFWIDFSDKMVKCKISQEIKEHFVNYVNEVFNIVGRKIMVQSESLLDDPDLKEDVTIDDINAMSFSQYRKQSTTLYQYVYNFYLSYYRSPNAYFDRCLGYISGEQKGKLGKGTELALFCIKSAIESMISEADAEYICKILTFVIEKGTNVYSSIAVQVLFLIRDCTRQIKRNNTLCMSALNYCLYFLKDQKICHYAALAFKNLMQTLTTLSDPALITNMLQYYQTQQFPNQQIIDKIIEGIFFTIVKMPNNEHVAYYIKQFVEIVLRKFENVHKNIKIYGDKPYLIPIKQIKTILQNFEGIDNKEFRAQHQQLYNLILSNGLKMITIVIPYCLSQKQNYVKYNQLGLSCSIFKQTLKLCKTDMLPELLNILDQILAVVLTPQNIIDMCPVLELLCYTMTSFIPRVVNGLTQWLMDRMNYIDNFFMTYMDPIGMADVDVIRFFYQIQEGLVLYNCQIFLGLGNGFQIFDLAMYILRHINQSKMQRKVVNFLYLCCQISDIFAEKYQKLIETIIGSIPIAAGISHHNMSKIYLMIAPKIPNIQDLVYKALRSNPYQSVSQKTATLLTKLLIFIMDPGKKFTPNQRQRQVMMMIKDILEIVKIGENTNKITQLQLRYTLWRRNQGQAQD